MRSDIRRAVQVNTERSVKLAEHTLRPECSAISSRPDGNILTLEFTAARVDSRDKLASSDSRGFSQHAQHATFVGSRLRSQ